MPSPPETAPAGALVRCLSTSTDEFARDYWSRKPLLSRAKELPAAFGDLLSDEDVDDLVADRALRTPFFRTVSDGAGKPVPVRSATAGNRTITDLVDPGALFAQHADGATLVLQSVHRMHPPVARFCRTLAEELGHPTQCNAYLTPGGERQGFAFHHDTHDVLVLQISGRKRWLVHAPVLPLPLRTQPRAGASLVADGQEPLLDTELEPGDCLYLPRGYVHAAQTTDEHSVHLTIGILTTTVADVLQDVLTLAGREERFRDGLPVQPVEQVAALLPDLLRDLADWAAQLDPADLEQLVQQRLAHSVPLEPVRLLAQTAAAREVTPTTAVRPRRGLRTSVEQRGERVVLQLPDRTVDLPAVATEALRRVVSAPATPTDLALDGLDAEDGVVIVRRLLREGAVVPA